MKVLKIDNKEVFLRYNMNNIKKLSKLGITIKTVSEGLQNVDIAPLSVMFYYGVKSLKPEVTEDETDSMIDSFFESEENGFEKLTNIILEEYSKALGIKTKSKEDTKQGENLQMNQS